MFVSFGHKWLYSCDVCFKDTWEQHVFTLEGTDSGTAQCFPLNLVFTSRSCVLKTIRGGAVGQEAASDWGSSHSEPSEQLMNDTNAPLPSHLKPEKETKNKWRTGFIIQYLKYKKLLRRFSLDSNNMWNIVIYRYGCFGFRRVEGVKSWVLKAKNAYVVKVRNVMTPHKTTFTDKHFW